MMRAQEIPRYVNEASWYAGFPVMTGYCGKTAPKSGEGVRSGSIQEDTCRARALGSSGAGEPVPIKKIKDPSGKARGVQKAGAGVTRTTIESRS